MDDIPIRLGRKRHCLAHVLGAGAVLLRCLGALRSSPRKPKSVVILEPFGLGDVLALEPLIRLLNGHEWNIAICAKRQWQPLIPAAHVDSWIPECIPWTSYDDGAKYRLDAFRTPQWKQFLAALKSRCQGCIGIDCRGDVRSVLLLYLAGCRPVLTFSKYAGYDLPMTPLAAQTAPVQASLRKWELNLGFARKLGINPLNPVPPPNAAHLLSSPVDKLLGSVGLIPVAPWKGRLWPESKWKGLVKQLEMNGKKSIGLHGPGQAGLAREMLGAQIPLMEAASPQDWAAKLAGLEQVVTLDSGPLHLADALGVRIVGLYGPGKLPLWAPSGRQSRMVHHQDRPDFYPCHQVNANIDMGLRYMDWIQVDEVVQAVMASSG